TYQAASSERTRGGGHVTVLLKSSRPPPFCMVLYPAAGMQQHDPREWTVPFGLGQQSVDLLRAPRSKLRIGERHTGGDRTRGHSNQQDAYDGLTHVLHHCLAGARKGSLQGQSACDNDCEPDPPHGHLVGMAGGSLADGLSLRIPHRSVVHSSGVHSSSGGETVADEARFTAL